MWAFQYKHGDRPLDGFTIQRAAGRGGFGEVYYALSDSGREVALKVVTGYEQIELRGISQCMNLKNPHLVSIFDVRYNDQNRPFVVMEFVAGPSLRQLLDESPGGLGAQKTAFFLREIGKGLTFLHDCGIVHRDLKPGNIFYENGYVKIGDYGLSKAMEPTQNSGQTITVGTVHYMAPEIGGGRYDKGIDIYAMGAVLFEMLTGQPPFVGASAGEILMKHVSTEPDLSPIEEPFRAVIRKAMAKDPADRYQSVQEMVEAVFGAEHIQQSVSCFSPDSLSMIAQRVAQRVAIGGGSATPPPIPRNGGGVATAPAAGERIGRMFDRVGDRIGALGNRVADLGIHALPVHARRDRNAPDDVPHLGDPLRDPLSKRQRRTLAAMMLLLIAAASGVLSPVDGFDGSALSFWGALLATCGATFGLLLAGHRILPQMASESGFLRRLACGGTSAALLMLVGLPAFAASRGSQEGEMAMTALGALLALLMVPPLDLSPARAERVAFGPVVGAAALGFAAFIFTQGTFGLLIAILSGSHLLAQVLSPWDPAAAKRRLGMAASSSTAGSPAAAPVLPPSPQAEWNSVRVSGDAPTMVWPPTGGAAQVQPVSPRSSAPVLRHARNSPRRAVPAFARYVWLMLIVLLIPVGVVLVVNASDADVRSDPFVGLTGFGVGLLALAALAFVKVWQSSYTTKWRYAGRYLLAWACFQTMMFPALALGNHELDSRAQAMAIFVILLCVLLIPIFLFIRFSSSGPTSYSERVSMTPPPPTAPAAPPPIEQDRAATVEMSGRLSRRQRRRARWNDASAWRVKGPPLHVRLINFVRDLVVGTSVTTLLLIGTAAFLFLAMDVPGMLAAGIPDEDIPRQMTREFGFSQWPQLLRGIGYVTGWVAMILAAAVLIVSRRNSYGLHILRGTAGVAVFAASMVFLDRALEGNWNGPAFSPPGEARAMISGSTVHLENSGPAGPWEQDIVAVRPGPMTHARHPNDDAERVARAFERYLETAPTQTLPLAGGIGLFGLVMMCWPARRPQDAAGTARVVQNA